MKYFNFLVSVLVLASVSASGATKLSALDRPFEPNYFDTLSFRLYPNETGFSLRNMATGFDYQIPRAMLTPPESLESELDKSDLMRFDSCVTAFPIGGNFVGIQLSSYYIGTGSMALAQGLDVFLTLDTAQTKVMPKVLHLGVTKQRSRYMGHFDALHTRFFLSHFGNGKYYSLGLFQEKIYFKTTYDASSVKGPYYEQTPIQWYVFDGDEWRYESSYDKRLPISGGELPLLGIIMTPVEYVQRIYQRRRN